MFLFPRAGNSIMAPSMSEENAQKLRLKPRLAGDPPASATPPSAEKPAPSAPDTTTPTLEKNSPIALRPKPRLGGETPPESSASSTAPVGNPASETPAAPPVAPASVAAPPKFVAPAPLASPPVTSPPATSPPAETSTTPTPAETARPKISFQPREPAVAPLPKPEPQATAEPPAAPPPTPPVAAAAPGFPPPPAKKFPPPPGVGKDAAGEPPVENIKAVVSAGTGSRKRLLLIGGVAAVAAVALASVFFLNEDEEQPRPVTKAPAPIQSSSANATEIPSAAAPVATVTDTIAKADELRVAAANEVAAVTGSDTAARTGDTVQPKEDATETVATPAVPSGPPPPSDAFRGWIGSLVISGVRSGSNPRIFIERTAYGPGDLINPQLGITFESYNPATRMLIFKDRSGAMVERRH